MLIVGASLAGLRAAEQLRALGHTGRIILLGDEAVAPYDRPPLSKSTLTGRKEASAPLLARAPELDLDLRLGIAATALDRDAKCVRLADATGVNFDQLLIATGRRARPLSDVAQASLTGVQTLRTAADAAELRALLLCGPARVVIIGAGFIGSEVASACRVLGLEVTVVARGETPLDGSLGASVGTLATELYRRNGVDLRCCAAVTEILGDSNGRVRGVELDDGARIEAQVVVVATGSLPNVEWLGGSGLDCGLDESGNGSAGIAVDGELRVLDHDGHPIAGIFAAGDVTRWAHPLAAGRLLSVEHWGNAVEQGRFAARSMLGMTTAGLPFVELPRFWSTMFGTSIKSLGVPSLGDEVVVVQGSIADRRGVAVYGRDGRTVAAVAFDSPRELDFFETMVTTGDTFPPRITVADWAGGEAPRPVAAKFPERNSTRPHATDGAFAGALAGTGSDRAGNGGARDALGLGPLAN